MRFRHAERGDERQHFLELRAALLELGVTAAERVELRERIGERRRARLDECEQLVRDRRRQCERIAGQRLAHVIRATLVELVDLTQHERLPPGILDAEHVQVAAHQLAVVDLDRERPDAEIAEHAVDDGRKLGVVAHRELILADDVDVALVELAESSALRALAAIDALDLVTAEREREIVLVLGDVARERHREIEPERQIGLLALLHANLWTGRNRPDARSRRLPWSGGCSKTP